MPVFPPHKLGYLRPCLQDPRRLRARAYLAAARRAVALRRWIFAMFFWTASR